MKPLWVIGQKLIVYPFYRDNTGFFFFWLLLLVVLQNPATFLFTEPFLSSVIQTPVILAIILAALFLYFLKCYGYVQAKLAQPEHEFLFITSLLPARNVWFSWLLVFGSVYLPAFFYLALLTGSSIRLRAGLTSLLLLSFGFILLPAKYRYLTIFSKYIGREATGLFLLTKVFTGAVTWAFLALYPVAEYGTRPAAIGFLIGLAGHSLLVFRTRLFEEERLLLLRQLPFSTGQRFLLFLVAYGSTLLPEGVFLLLYRDAPLSFWEVFAFYLFGLGFLLLLHGLLYRQLNQDNYFRQVFFLFIGFLFLILFYVPLEVLAGLSFGISLLLLRRYYYGFQAP